VRQFGSFVEYSDDESFTAAADDLGRAAARETSKNLEGFTSVAMVASLLNDRPVPSAWQRYHAIMASLAIDDIELARAHQTALAEIDHPTDWFVALQARAKECNSASNSG